MRSGNVRASHRALLAAVVSIAVAMVAAAGLLYRSMWRDGRERAGATLDAVAALKVSFLTAWRAEHQRDVVTAAGFPSVVAYARERARGTDTGALRAHISDFLGQLAATQGHRQIAIVDGEGRDLLLWSAFPGRVDPVDLPLVRRAQASGAGTALLETPDRDHVTIQVAAAVEGPAPRLVVVLSTDLVDLYNQAIHAWPVPSRSGETGLVRRVGDQALVFGGPGVFPEGRNHRLLPLASADLPAVQALRGRRGVVEGIDSEGRPVLAAIRGVPESDWMLVSKMDLEEIDAPLRRPFLVIVGLLAALLGAGGVFLWQWWRHEAARARVDEALRESREVFQLALAGTHVVWDWDLDAGRLRLEREWSEDSTSGGPARVFEGSVDAIAAELVHPDDREAAREQLEAHLRGETPRLAVELRSSAGGNGPERWFFVRGSGSRRDATGRAHRLTGVVSDVSARREMQAQLEQAERLASVGSLAAAVAHEINNPLAYVLANLGFLASRCPAEQKPEEAEALADARDGAERVRDVVRGLRTFSRPGAGPRAAVDVGAEITAALRIAQNEIRHRARLVQRIGPLPQVMAGPHELGQLFVNLLVNAAHAIPPGRAQANTITVEAGTDASGWARVEVRDSGVGMPPQVLRRLFDPFFTTKPEGKGMGLGMVIARGIVDGAGGRIEVESAVGEGTTVRVLLPPAPQAPQEAGAAAASAEPPTRRRVLLVDDDPLVARSVVRSLGDAHDVVATSSGAEALARLDAGERFDAVLCDVMMPEMTGAQLYARVEARDPQLARRFVFLTGGAFTEEAMEFLRRVAGPCLDKPFDADQLRRALDWAARKPDVHVPRMTPRPWRPEKPVV